MRLSAAASFDSNERKATEKWIKFLNMVLFIMNELNVGFSHQKIFWTHQATYVSSAIRLKHHQLLHMFNLDVTLIVTLRKYCRKTIGPTSVLANLILCDQNVIFKIIINTPNKCTPLSMWNNPTLKLRNYFLKALHLVIFLLI